MQHTEKKATQAETACVAFLLYLCSQKPELYEKETDT
jgi:hypothetical protein